MSETLCPLPWMHLATHPDGKVTLCCISDHTNNMSAAKQYTEGKPTLLNLNKDKIINIVNSDYFVETRKEMLEGKQPKACSRCYKEEATGIFSKRKLELLNYGNTFSESVIKPNMKFVELRMGNLCNVKCRTCNPNSSSQWVSEYKTLQKDLPFVTQYNSKLNSDWTQDESFWEELLSFSDKLETIYINGGEPTLVEKHWNYLERLIERGLHTQITLWYSINMTNLPDKLLAIWKQFKKVIVHASIDDLGERNQYIRKGTSWVDVEANLDKLKENNWIETSVTQTISWMNVYYLHEFNEYFNKCNLNVNTNLVYDPKFYSISILPDFIKSQLRERLKNFPDVLQHMSSEVDVELFGQGLQYNRWLDESRTEKFAEYFPEWAQILGY